MNSISSHHYRIAIFLGVLLTACNLSFATYLTLANGRMVEGITIHTAIAATVVFGLWAQSNALRYIGGAWFVLATGSALWPLLTQSFVWSTGVLWVIVMGGLSLALAYLLLVSKKFSTEFSLLLNKRPHYKKKLVNVFLILVGAAALAATFRDILNLAAAP